MKLSLLLTLLLSIFSGFSESSSFDADKAELPSLFNPADAGHLLLVGFYDQTINRPQTITSTSTYRRRGSYQSSTWSKRITEQIAEDYHLQKISEWPMTEVGVHCVVYRVPATEVIPETMQKMALDRRISVVQKMNLFNTKAYEYNDPYYKLQSNMKLMQIDKVHAKTTGRNVIIGMIDTGVDLDHPDLRGQITESENFAEGISPGFSSDKHGTAVAGIIVAKKDNGTGIIGVAPNAKLVALKACWPDQADSMASVCNSYTLARAVNTAIKLGVKVLNMSLTGPQDPLLEILLDKAIEKGIVVVAADTGLNDENSNFPASLKNVIPVRVIGQAGADQNTNDSAISAPGDNILTTLPHGTYDFISGSSIAAAEVSGIVALLLELKPDLVLHEIKSILLKSGRPEEMNMISVINANHAVIALCETTSCQEDNLSFALGDY